MKVHSGKFKRHKYYMRYCSLDGAKHLDIFKCVNPNKENYNSIDIVLYGDYCLGKTYSLYSEDYIPKFYVTKNYDKKRTFINISVGNQVFFELTQDEFLMQVLGETI